jgi:hypothetical protein
VLTEPPVKLINGARTKSEPDLRAGRTTAYPVSSLRVRSREWKLLKANTEVRLRGRRMPNSAPLTPLRA